MSSQHAVVVRVQADSSPFEHVTNNCVCVGVRRCEQPGMELGTFRIRKVGILHTFRKER